MNILEAFETLDSLSLVSTQITADEFEHIASNCVNIFIRLLKDKLNFSVAKINQFKDNLYFSKNFKASNCFGVTTLTIQNNSLVWVIAVNEGLLYHELLDKLTNTIYHELCHAAQFLDGTNEHFYYIDTAGRATAQNDPNLAAYYEGDDGGHSACWQRYVDVVNSARLTTIPIRAHPAEHDLDGYYKYNADKFVMEIYCDSCTLVEQFIDLNKYDIRSWLDDIDADYVPPLLAIILDTKSGRRNNFCARCGGSLLIRFRNAQVEKRMLIELINYNLSYFFNLAAQKYGHSIAAIKTQALADEIKKWI